MNYAYTYVLNTMADWEAGLAVAELNTQRFFEKRRDFEVKTFALNKEPVKTLGGFTIVPDFKLNDIKPENAVLLILPGAEDWGKPEHEQVLELAKDFLAADIPVAAICGATEAMARIGMLNEVEHTSNGLEFLKMTCPGYNGEHLYKNQTAVTDGNLITAGSSSSVAFAYQILKKLEAMKPDKLEYWNGYFENHSQQDILKLIEEE